MSDRGASANALNCRVEGSLREPPTAKVMPAMANFIRPSSVCLLPCGGGYHARRSDARACRKARRILSEMGQSAGPAHQRHGGGRHRRHQLRRSMALYGDLLAERPPRRLAARTLYRSGDLRLGHRTGHTPTATAIPASRWSSSTAVNSSVRWPAGKAGGSTCGPTTTGPTPRHRAWSSRPVPERRHDGATDDDLSPRPSGDRFTDLPRTGKCSSRRDAVVAMANVARRPWRGQRQGNPAQRRHG